MQIKPVGDAKFICPFRAKLTNGYFLRSNQIVMRAALVFCILIIVGCGAAAPAINSSVTPPKITVSATPPSAPPRSRPFPLQAVAIFTAISVFLAREGLEAKRRYSARKRQLAALKANLARQCEFNNWSYRSLKGTIEHVQGSLEEGDGVHRLKFQRNGSIRLTTIRKYRGGSSTMLPLVRVSEFEARLMQAAELDEGLQKLTDEAAGGSAEMLHVRDSLISYVQKEEDDEEMEVPDGVFLDFTRYALEQLESTYRELNALYVYCTGNQLTAHRLR